MALSRSGSAMDVSSPVGYDSVQYKTCKHVECIMSLYLYVVGSLHEMGIVLKHGVI